MCFEFSRWTLKAVGGLLVSACVLTGSSYAQEVVALQPGPLAGAWLVPDVDTGRVEVNFVILSGEADNPGTEGMAHYLEHLAAASVREGGEADFERDSNASTGSASTSYWLEGDADDLVDIVGSLARVFSPIDLAENFMLEERDIVQREYDFRRREDPYALLAEDFTRREHDNGPLGRSLIGTPEDIAAFSLEEMRALHAATHRPHNAVLLIYGDVDVETANRAIAETFGPGSGGGARAQPSYAMPPIERDQRVVDDTGLPQPNLAYSKIIALGERHDVAGLYFGTWLLAEVLDSRLPGGMARALQYDSPAAQTFDTWIEVLDNSHLRLLFYATPDADVTPETLLTAFEDALAQSVASGIPEETLTRVRQRIVNALQQYPEPARVVRDAAFTAVDLGLVPWDFDGYLQGIERVSVEQINALLTSFASPGRVTIDVAYP